MYNKIIFSKSVFIQNPPFCAHVFLSEPTRHIVFPSSFSIQEIISKLLGTFKAHYVARKSAFSLSYTFVGALSFVFSDLLDTVTVTPI